ncbi:M23 family metallopeptidase [Streptomyces sp. PU-14G]|uniref:M23 family metallopeptidase n=1 Tax=Streptomyces sp. PU-14G TaxID=2800808 RepID=UPI0034E02379
MASTSQGPAPEAVGYDPQPGTVGSPAPTPASAPYGGPLPHGGALPHGGPQPYGGALPYGGPLRSDGGPQQYGGGPSPYGGGPQGLSHDPQGFSHDPQGAPRPNGESRAGADEPSGGDGPWEDWNPTEEATRSLRGKHRVARQRTGGVARGGAVLGVGMIAAVGAGGMATAHDKDPGSISVPDIGAAADTARDLTDHLPDAEDIPGLGAFVSDGTDGTEVPDGVQAAHGADAVDAADTGGGSAGEALRARILAQAERHHAATDAQAREDAARQAASAAAQEAAKRAAAEERARTEAQEERRREAAAAKAAEAAEEAKAKAAAERRAKLARSYVAPVASYQLSAGFGQSGGRWQNDHTGQDFAAPNGTPVKAIHTGTVKEAGWAGSYGYRVVLELDDGTELWFCHLSSMTKSAGDKVSTGDVIGRVGSTGNSSGPHLHVEVRPDGGAPVDPLTWLRDKGVKV